MTLQIVTRPINWNLNICVAKTPIKPCFYEFLVEFDTHFSVDAVVGVKHRGNYPTGIGWAMQIGLRGPAATQAGVQIATGLAANMPPVWLATDTGNLYPDGHYATAHLVGYRLLVPGWYRVEPWGNMHGSSSGPVVSGGFSALEINAEGQTANPPYSLNNFRYRLEEA